MGGRAAGISGQPGERTLLWLVADCRNPKRESGQDAQRICRRIAALRGLESGANWFVVHLGPVVSGRYLRRILDAQVGWFRTLTVWE